jgi:hypothetical protein
MPTSALTIQQPDIEKTLESVFSSHGYQQEAMSSEYLRVRRKALGDAADAIDESEAEFDVRSFLSKDETKRKAVMALAENALSPIVSRETQLAILKQLIIDFNRNKKRPGLNALTVMKAVELINKMCGFEKAEKVEHSHEHKITVFPVISQSFKGELSPLKVFDVRNEEDGIVDAVVLPAEPQTEITPESF